MTCVHCGFFQEEALSAIYTVLIGAVAASFDAERSQHLISRDCLTNLRQCLEVSLDLLTKGVTVEDHPLLAFMDEVKRWIHHGRTGLTMSHHLFDQLLMSTEMLYGVITTFRDLNQVAQKVKLPDWYLPTIGYHCIVSLRIVSLRSSLMSSSSHNRLRSGVAAG